MKIKRMDYEIESYLRNQTEGVVAIELSAFELAKAWKEYQRIQDERRVVVGLQRMFEDKSIGEDVLADGAFISKIAEKMRFYIEHADMSESDAFNETMTDWENEQEEH